jgi:hypothetical protein
MKKILCISWFELNSATNFWVEQKPKQSKIIFYYKPLVRKFEEVKCQKHKNWWFVVKSYFGICVFKYLLCFQIFMVTQQLFMVTQQFFVIT